MIVRRWLLLVLAAALVSPLAATENGGKFKAKTVVILMKLLAQKTMAAKQCENVQKEAQAQQAANSAAYTALKAVADQLCKDKNANQSACENAKKNADKAKEKMTEAVAELAEVVAACTQINDCLAD